jgi:ABC-2 type transport system ATP-binding protein
MTMRYGDNLALNAFSIDTGQFSSVALLGPNGAGKSTLADILVGLKKPNDGSYQFKKNNIIPAIQFQNVPLFPTLSVSDNVALYREIHGIASDLDKTLDRLSRWNLIDKLEIPTKALSGGQKQSLAIVLALIGKPNFIILDEPMNNLDPSARSKLRRNIEELREDGVDVLLISHDLAEVANVAEYFVFMKEGENAFSGTMSEIEAKFGAASLEVAYQEVMN